MTTKYLSIPLLLLIFLFSSSVPEATAADRRIAAETSPQTSERRLALIIGNGAYKDSPLVNPSNDAESMATALKKVGFDVLLKKNLNRKEMRGAIREFGDKLAATGGMGLFYYAGHGMAVQGNNYLIPVGADIQRANEIEDEAISAASILKTMDDAKNGLNLIVLDACRNNPFASRFRSSDKGLATMSPPSGVLVLYATSPGSVASDGSGSNGVFTKHFIDKMALEGVDIRMMIGKVAEAVRQETANDQSPYMEGMITGEFAFRVRSGVSPQPPTVDTADTLLLDLRMWEGAQKANSVAAYRVYLNKHPNGEYAEMAKVMIASLERETVVAPVTLAGARAQAPTGASGSLSDEEKKFQSTLKEAQQGDAAAQCNLGEMYEKGRGVVKDEVEAVKWFRKAVEQGFARAQYHLGVSYDNGRGVVKDEVEAVKWYRKAAEQGDAAAQYNLGVSYDNGSGVVKDTVEAVKWYRKAAEQGDADAQYNLGFSYDNGSGVVKDAVEAVKWYRKAAEQGHVSAQYNLGVSYANGSGVAKDEVEAVKWYRKAAEQGDTDAQAALKRREVR